MASIFIYFYIVNLKGEKYKFMKRVVNKLDNTKVEVVCDLDEKVWKEAQEKAF